MIQPDMINFELRPQAHEEGRDPRTFQIEKDEAHAHGLQDDPPPPRYARILRRPRGLSV